MKHFYPAAHVHRIVLLSTIYSKEAVERAMDDVFVFQAFSAEYIANILEQKSMPVEKAGSAASDPGQ